jgi:PhnB protein
MAVNPIPEGYHSITPRLFVPDADSLIEFLKSAFGAVERPRVGKGSPAEMVIGDSIVIVSASGVRPAVPAFLYLYVPDTDAAYRKALKAGAKSLEAPADMHYGDRRAMIEDRQANTWQIATHVEDVSPEEIARRLNGRR